MTYIVCTAPGCASEAVLVLNNQPVCRAHGEGVVGGTEVLGITVRDQVGETASFYEFALVDRFSDPDDSFLQRCHRTHAAGYVLLKTGVGADDIHRHSWCSTRQLVSRA